MKKNLISGLGVGASVGLLAALVALFRPSWVEGLELYTYDVRARVAANRKRADPRIVMVDVDDYDIRWVQRHSGLSWPWPREIFAVAAKHLLERGAAAVVFDFLFVDPGNSGVEDVERFSEVLGSSPRTIIGMELSRFGRVHDKPGPWAAKLKTFPKCVDARKFGGKLLWWQTHVFLQKKKGGGCELWVGGERSEEALAEELKRLGNQQVFAKFLTEKLKRRKLSSAELARELTEEQIVSRRGALPHEMPEKLELRSYPHIIPPLIPLVMSSKLGVVRQDPDSDGLYRRYAPVMVHDGKLFPSLGMVVATTAFKDKKLDVSSQGLRFDGHRVPIDENGRVVLRFHGSGNTYSQVGIRHILNVVAQNMELETFRSGRDEYLEMLKATVQPPEAPPTAKGLRARNKAWKSAVEALSGLAFPKSCKEKLAPLLKTMKGQLPYPNSEALSTETSSSGSKGERPRPGVGSSKAALAVKPSATAVKPSATAVKSVAQLVQRLETKGCKKTVKDTLKTYLEKADRKNAGSLARVKEIEPGTIKGRVFIIHAAAAALRDLKPTPLHAQGFGAEVNATFLDNLLNDDFICRVPRWVAAFLSLLLCLVLGVSAFLLVGWVRSAVLAAASSFLVTGVAIGSFGLLAHVMFKGQGIWLDVAAPSLGALLTWAAVVAVHIYQESQDRRFVQDALGRYTSPALVQELMKNPKALSLEWGESRALSVFFSDVVSFTSISERLGPQKLVVLLNEYLTAMTDIILEEGGIVDKYIGDAIMAFWGAPVSDEEHAVHACRAALRTSAKLQDLQADWKKRFGETIDFRAGINSGEAVVGNMGSLHKYNYTVMGDTVNLAARLEGANKLYNTRLMIAQGTWALVSDDMVARELDFMAVKGKDEPVKVYELLGEKGQVDEAVMGLVDRFEGALRIYQDRGFAEAKKIFQAILEDYPSDGPSALYVERCKGYEDTPPPEDWDGVFRMTTK